jgi:hypothetical protein
MKELPDNNNEKAIARQKLALKLSGAAGLSACIVFGIYYIPIILNPHDPTNLTPIVMILTLVGAGLVSGALYIMGFVYNGEGK